MFEGAYTAIVTPFQDGKVHVDTLKKLVERQIENGISGIVPCGTTGESPTLSHEEHHQVVESTIRFAAGRVKVIAGSGSNSTSEAVELTEHAREAGADAALVITPYYNKPTQQGLYLHFKKVAESVDIPIVLYNVPGRTGVNLEVDTIVRLADIPNIVAVKEASGSLIKVARIVSRTRLKVLSGEDPLTFPIMAIGGHGVISVTANVAPQRVATMVQCALQGDHPGALELHHRLFDLSSKLFLETNPIPVKAALSMMGLVKDELRLPLCPMSDDKRPILRAELEKLELLS
jgi:4-hydroxy-tetrahydrodipicolinate synthase